MLAARLAGLIARRANPAPAAAQRRWLNVHEYQVTPRDAKPHAIRAPIVFFWDLNRRSFHPAIERVCVFYACVCVRVPSS